ncbi:GAF domain-containing sensor histidine kinase, partial [Candidatus Saccharibacteria bacterium]|nr:GAF domain-containing sensor histidine kinase [Candidatus Saccharibacteria bacterium]
DELGDVLVAEINLDKILTGTRNVLIKALKSSFIEFILIENKNNQPQSDTTKNHGLEAHPDQLLSVMKGHHQEVIFRDELGLDNPLRNLLTQKNVAIGLRLKTQQKVVGYILIGDKRSGYVYSSQDTKLLLIVADEVAIAIRNAMRFEEIQRFNITLQQKIEEATRELKRVNARLRELDKTKDEFISMASHQLRTPLTTVKGYLSMVLDGDTGPVKKTQKEMVSKAFSGAQKMVYLIADMLNVSRLQTGKFVIENQPTDLGELVEGEIAQLQETADSRKLKLIYHKPAKFPVLNLDETKIRQVVMNFLDNAIHYTPSGGSITAELTSSDEEVRFSVTDTGLGVPVSAQHHLFSKFYRADNARKMRPDGTGLGLFMAKKVIVAQGGAIIFKSTEGKGSTFGFSLPRHATEVKDKKTSEKLTAKQEVATPKA